MHTTSESAISREVLRTMLVMWRSDAQSSASWNTSIRKRGSRDEAEPSEVEPRHNERAATWIVLVTNQISTSSRCM